uniref:Serine carboxypeptidase-like 10 n=2 Tax=Noccaea caerulescens TaxID=107243 RepID=A0A1J3EAP8_NOCCA
MFYYFIKSEKNPKEDPLLISLNGGPGCSSLEGLLLENGPLGLKLEIYNGSVPTLVSTTYSWTKMANIIFLDQPVGAGFSYSKTPLGKTSDTIEIKRIHEFIQKWLSKHPQFYSNPFYVIGDSYAGMIVPPLVQEISKGNYICCKPLINLQGYVLGNPITYAEFETNYRIPFAHGMSLISDELYQSMNRICNGNYGNVDPRNTECLKHVEEFHKCTDKLNTQHILIPNCDEVNTQLTSPDCYYYVYFLLETWANNERVREALHVDKGTKGQWARCNWTIPYDNDIINSIPYHKNNSISGYRSLIYSGDHDITMPFQATQAWIKSLNYSITHDWRPWMIKDQIAGYTRSYANKMTFATVKGGGHTAEYKPNETFIVFQRWISGQPL